VPFAVLALDGYGRRPIPTLAWDLLTWSAGRPIGLVPDGRLAVISVDPEAPAPPARSPASVRITAGDGAGGTGLLVALAGPSRRPGGLYQPCGVVAMDGGENVDAQRRIVPLADLERLG
jgi:hypothetical protein